MSDNFYDHECAKAEGYPRRRIVFATGRCVAMPPLTSKHREAFIRQVPELTRAQRGLYFEFGWQPFNWPEEPDL